MSEVSQVAYCAAALSGGTGLLYAGVLLFVALVSVLARTPERRKDARTTLSILMRRRTR
ncbi:hypothetical protein [Streptomyces sp. NPDC045369]|uniref:hypothetical protein n=1 Tax=Streptomyces sp. NPDC045369 TaxID=3155732 RepID=UPI0034087838